MSKSNSPNGKKVGLFATCLVDLIRPEVGFATAKLIEDAGFELDVPRTQTCCGQPLYNNGDFEGARKIARKLIETFAGYDYIVAPSGSCAATIKLHFPELLAEDPPDMRNKTQDVAEKTYELTQFLTTVADANISAEFRHNCTYHDSCAGFRELGIRSSPRALMSKVSGLSLTECNDSTACCGFGGTFCVKYPQISVHIATEKTRNIQQTGASMLLGGDLGCLMNIAGTLSRQGSDIRVLHVAEVLAGCGDNPAIGHPQT